MRKKTITAESTFAIAPLTIPAPVKHQHYKSSNAHNIEFYFALAIVVTFTTIFILGYLYWDERYYSPGEGLGYYMGLVGGSMMLLAFGYTLFKYLPALRSNIVMKFWLTAHLVFGIIGPTLIMFHSTFRIGSLNGGIALISMGIMFLSGVMARFLYSKTHLTLNGNESRVKEIQELLKVSGQTIKSDRLTTFTEIVLTRSDKLSHAIWKLINFTWQRHYLYLALTTNLNQTFQPIAIKQNWDAVAMHRHKKQFKLQLKFYMHTLKKVALLDVYVRFFTFWRDAHVPISYMLLMSGVIHVIAVHMY